MKILRITIAVICAAVLSIAGYLHFINRDTDIGPTIECTVDGNIVTTVNADDKELLKFFKAYDEKDGDLSDKIAVTRKKYFVDDGTVIAVFAVCDSDNNVAAITKSIRFTDYIKPIITLRTDFFFPSNTSYSYLSNFVSATDIIDGDISHMVKVISPDFSYVKGTYPVTIKVTNSMGDSSEITIDAYVVDNYNQNFRIELTDYIAYIKTGDEFDAASYIDKLNNKTDNENYEKYKKKNVIIDDSGLDTSKPGVYNVFYKINKTGSDEVLTETRLVVVVEEAEQ